MIHMKCMTKMLFHHYYLWLWLWYYFIFMVSNITWRHGETRQKKIFYLTRCIILEFRTCACTWTLGLGLDIGRAIFANLGSSPTISKQHYTSLRTSSHFLYPIVCSEALFNVTFWKFSSSNLISLVKAGNSLWKAFSFLADPGF